MTGIERISHGKENPHVRNNLISKKTVQRPQLEQKEDWDKSLIKTDKGEKVTFGEGLKLVTKGFLGKTSEVFKAIIKHPLQVLGAVGLTTAGLLALPAIGIASSTGAGFLALIFAGIALFNTGKHTISAVKNNKKENYNALRQDLKKIGGDGLDLALSAPFVPKAINSIKRQIKYTQNGLKPAFNKDLQQSLKETRGLWNKIKEFSKADLRISYQQHINEMNLKFFPELKFKKLPRGTAGGFDNEKGVIEISNSLLNPFLRSMGDGFLKHELEHFLQAKTMARKYGVNVFDKTTKLQNSSENIQSQIKNVEAAIEKFKNPPPAKNIFQKITKPIFKKIFGKWYLKKLEREKAMLKTDIKFNKVANNFENKFSAKYDNIFKNIDIKNLKTKFKKQKLGTNKEFYQKIIDTEGKIQAGTKEAAQAEKYFEAAANYVQPKGLVTRKLYFKNLLEKEAYAVQKKYAKLRPGSGVNSLQATTNIADHPGGNKLS